MNKRKKTKLVNEILKSLDDRLLKCDRYNYPRYSITNAVKLIAEQLGSGVISKEEILNSSIFQKVMKRLPAVIDQWITEALKEVNQAKKRQMNKDLLIEDIYSKLSEKDFAQFKKMFGIID